MGRRRHQRFKKELTVEVHATSSLNQSSSQTASVVDVSESGVRLQGVHVLYRTGQTVILEHKGNKAQYRVIWLGAGALAGQAGLINLEPQKSIFNLRFPPSGSDKYVVPSTEGPEMEHPGDFDDGFRRLLEQRRQAERRKQERRKAPRYGCTGEAEIYVEGTQFAYRGRLTDISRTGCFLELLSSLPFDTHVTLVLRVWQRQIRIKGVVRSMLPNFGLGIQFLHLDPLDQHQLDEVLAALAAGAPAPETSPEEAAPAGAVLNIDPQHGLEAVKTWFGDHDVLTRQQFLELLHKLRTQQQ
jgi:PilZ domain